MNKKSKKLILSSETLRHLDDDSLKDAQGMLTSIETAVCTACTRLCTICCK